MSANGNQALRHGMLAGSHERAWGPECRCGAQWDRWNDKCWTSDDTQHGNARSEPVA